jgi:hypothetical protein
LETGWKPGKEGRCAVFNGNLGVAVLALGSRAHLAAQVVNDELESVADAQHRHAQFQQFGVGGGGVRVVDRRGAAGEDDAERVERLNLAEGRRTGQHHGKNVLLARTPGDELRVLRAEIEDNNCLGVHVPVWQGRGRDVKKRRGERAVQFGA